MHQSLKFKSSEKSQFYATLKHRVDAYFAEKKISKHANGHMYFKTVFFVSGVVGLYWLLISGTVTGGLAMLGVAAVLGMFKAFTCFNVGHDSIHGAYSSKKWVNDVMSMTFNVLGANAYVWKITHNIVHHTFTNIPGHDEDIDVAPGLIRLSPAEKHKPIMRFQHYYAFLLYGFASLSWVFRKDYMKFFQKKIGNYENSNHPPREYFLLFFYKAIYYTLFIVLPIIFMDINVWQFILGFVVMHLAEGLVLGLVFQLAHVVEDTAFPYPDNEGVVREDWAIHQMRTTADFARKSFLAYFLCGGLNFQIEHHLFPKICHIHYPELSEIVKATAEEHGVPYNDNPTFALALKSHFVMLKRFADPDFRVA